jgi:hypothetical protein
MRKLDQRGVAALEFCLVAVPLFTLIFAIFDLGRYAITIQSLGTLANAGARAMMINDCYVNNVIKKATPTCSGDPLPGAGEKQNVAPFLYAGSLTPSLNIVASGSALKVTASQPNFTMMMPIWGTTLNAPSASTSVAF